jgi:hypothetical protein
MHPGNIFVKQEKGMLLQNKNLAVISNKMQKPKALRLSERCPDQSAGPAFAEQ